MLGRGGHIGGDVQRAADQVLARFGRAERAVG
jgi:hypothetical protein